MNDSSQVKRGVFFVIEGTDGSGKGTQFKLLAEKLESEGYDVAMFDFPLYEEPSSYFVREYLNGHYGSGDQVGPYTASLFFALNRYDISFQIKEALAAGKVVLANRFTGSNMAHQGGKFQNAEERRGYFIWLDNLEFEMLGIPRPDKSFVLRVPAEVAQKLVDEKPSRSYTVNKRDIHEADINHLRKSVEVYDDLCQLFPKDFTRIDCVRDGALLSIEAIQDILWKTIEPLLPAQVHAVSQPAVATSTPSLSSEVKQYIIKNDDKTFAITPDGQEFLNQAVTNISGNVYTFTDKLSPITIAAAMARLSRRGDDMRITLLDEFAGNEGRDADLLKRVITAYGDDSVQQLAGLHVVVENASNLLTKQLEWGRLAAYLEQSTRYIYFDQRQADGRYKYFLPPQLDNQTRDDYVQTMDTIFDLYSDMVHELTDYISRKSTVPKAEQDGAWRSAIRAQACDAIRPVLPVATKSTVGIFASAQALESLIMHLRASDSLEAQTVGDQILEEARKAMPTFLERADNPERGGATTAYLANTRHQVADLAKQYLTESYGEMPPAVQLIRAWPVNELELIPYMLYESSSLSIKELQSVTEKWSIEQKMKVFETYVGERLNRRHRPGRALEQAHYTWDLVCDYGIFRDLQRHRMVDDLEWQALSPRYGFDVPELVSEAGLDDKFERCFDLSAQLYSQLQATGYTYEAQYATLLGHKMRWTVTYNAREAFHLHELRTSPQGHPGYRKLVQQMHEQLAEKHPLLAEAMKFVNKGEDPELTRLAAERATQFKLEKLSGA
ncbi:MAG TPA: FAD-dependent thymidylate synthase [Candidatus Saccharimonadales bacterium]|nr:FAD-dependent thymidylate synthase [Candidatus Saccharimonadales bacterium]